MIKGVYIARSAFNFFLSMSLLLSILRIDVTMSLHSGFFGDVYFNKEDITILSIVENAKPKIQA